MGLKRLRWLLPILLVLLSPALAHAQFSSTQGWCEDGDQVATVSGIDSTNHIQASYPLCTVAVLIHGGGPATIYSDSSGTPLANPFTANSNGQWQFFAAGGSYDVTTLGGTPDVMPTPVTYSSVIVGTGTGVSTISVGNLVPIFTASVANPTSTPAVTFTLTAAAANTVLANCTSGSAAPTYCTLTTAMVPAPGSNTQMNYNSMGLFAATPGVTFDATNRRINFVNGTNNAFLSLQPGTISFATGGGTTPPRISAVFSAFDFIGGASDDLEFGQNGNGSHFVLSGSNLGQASLGAGGNHATLSMNDGTNGSGMFQGPDLVAASATPEGTTTARVGSIFMNAAGAATTSIYVKESGTGNTGWQQFAMQDDIQNLTNKTLLDTTTTIANTSALTKTLKFDLSGATASTRATLAFIQSTARTYTFPDATGTVCLTNSGCPPLYNSTGTVQATSHSVIGTCILGTSCAVTLTGASVYTGAATYVCTALDQTAAAAIKIVQASGSGFTLTGTGTDTLQYSCNGN